MIALETICDIIVSWKSWKLFNEEEMVHKYFQNPWLLFTKVEKNFDGRETSVEVA